MDVIVAITEIVYGVKVWEDVSVTLSDVHNPILRLIWTVVMALPDSVRWSL